MWYGFACFLYLLSFLGYIGKILEDEKQIAEYKIEEKNFVVIMVNKVCFNVAM